MTSTPRAESDDNAHRLVGRFLQHFGELESTIDRSIGRIFGLDVTSTAIICASLPFAKKVEVLFAADKFAVHDVREFMAQDTDRLRSRILALNDQRAIAAHCQFEALDDGISFKRVVVRGELKISTVIWSEQRVEQLCDEAVELGSGVAALPPFAFGEDMRDPRNAVMLYAAGII